MGVRQGTTGFALGAPFPNLVLNDRAISRKAIKGNRGERIRKDIKRRGGARMRRILLLLILMGFIPGLVFSGGLTSTEKSKVESDATDAFNRIIRLWKDGRFEDLYEHGYRRSQIPLSKENFVIKMRNKSHEFASSWETIRDMEAEVASHKLVYVRAKIGYRSKGGGDTKFLTGTYRVEFEGDRWRIDLSKILRSPF